MSLDEPEPVDSVLTFLSGYDTLKYSWVKATAVSVRLRILFVTLQSSNNAQLYMDRLWTFMFYLDLHEIINFVLFHFVYKRALTVKVLIIRVSIGIWIDLFGLQLEFRSICLSSD